MIRDSSLTLSGLLSSDELNDVLFCTFARASWLLSLFIFMLYYVLCVRINNKLVDAIYFDFKKPFDKMPHGRLMSKVRGWGVDGKVYNWINNWLNGREQRVIINSIHSV